MIPIFFYPANGVFPEGSAFGGDKVTTESYDPEGAKKVLEEAGWKAIVLWECEISTKKKREIRLPALEDEIKSQL